MKSVISTKKAGRPRGFCPEEALETALYLFWRKGYEGTSMSDLTETIGVNRPSLYAAFGSKQELFRRVLDHYAARHKSALDAALALPTARDVAEVMLMAYARERSESEVAGCLLVQGALACSDESNTIRVELAARREAMVDILRGRFEQAKADGDFPADTEPTDMARYLATVMNGMSVQAAGGASAEDLRHVAEVALRVWPEDTLP